MPQKPTREILSVPNIADGNPATAMALRRQAHKHDIQVHTVMDLPLTSALVNIFHQNVTSDAERAHEYTDKSEIKRASPAARLYGHASFLEFAQHVPRHSGEKRRWNVIQEHQLLGAWPQAVSWLGIESIRLVTPDVYPKESGILAVQKHHNAVISVWNRSAYEELQERGIQTELTKPYFLDGFRPNVDHFKNEGMAVVVKSSGSGMPKMWERHLKQSLAPLEQSWAFHTPTGRLSSEATRATFPTKEQRLEAFFNDLGGKTRLVIGYPSELVGIACEMREREVPLWMLALPPRGSHEKRNLRFGIDHGIILGELMMRPSSVPTFEDATMVYPAEISTLLRDLPLVQARQDVVGTQPFWNEEPTFGDNAAVA